jgi:hypothetical protein
MWIHCQHTIKTCEINMKLEKILEKQTQSPYHKIPTQNMLFLPQFQENNFINMFISGKHMFLLYSSLLL